MEQIACVESEFVVPGVIYAEGKLRHPFRLYSNEEGSVCVLVCEAPIMIEGMPSGALFISSTRGIPDPEGAAILLESLDKITDNKSLEIDTQQLKKQEFQVILEITPRYYSTWRSAVPVQ